MIDSDNKEVENIIRYYIEAVRREGGYIHPDLIFHCQGGDLYLSGVDEESIRFPRSLSIPYHERERSAWWMMLIGLGKAERFESDAQFWATRNYSGHLVPLVDMANHSCEGKTLRQDEDFIYMEGSEIKYTNRSNKYLEKIHGVEFT